MAFSQSARWPSLDLDRANGCIRSFEHAFSKEGGLAVLRGNIALDGCVVKTAGVDDSLLVFEGPAHVVESQDEAVDHILDDQVKAGDVVIVRYEGAQGRPRHAGDAVPDQLHQVRAWARFCACDRRPLLRPSGIHRPRLARAAAGGTIGLVKNGDRIRIGIPNRSISMLCRRKNWSSAAWSRTLELKPAQPRPRRCRQP